MIPAISPDVRARMEDAAASPWRSADGPAVLDRQAVEALLPHRDPFLFVDEVVAIDPRRVVARVDPRRRPEVFDGHFPGDPRWPGVLQVEAVAQAGLLLQAWRDRDPRASYALTHVLGARFVRPVGPDAPITLVAEVFEDGLFAVAVGQVLQGGALCSAIAVNVL